MDGTLDGEDDADLVLFGDCCAQSYRGCAIGKGQQAAKTEIEKYKLFDLPCREAMKYVAKMCVFFLRGRIAMDMS